MPSNPWVSARIDEAWIYDAAMSCDAIAAATGEDETMTIDGTEVRTGPLQVTLVWRGMADLDLNVTDPSGSKVDYRNTRITSGGFLDVDAQGACDNPRATTTTRHVENIVWETAPPSGSYQIEVDHYAHCSGDAGPVEYTITLRRDGQVLPGWPRTETVAVGAEKTYTHSVQ
jgi:uncharacterized protein YfaP (DUF2135 family)